MVREWISCRKFYVYKSRMSILFMMYIFAFTGSALATDAHIADSALGTDQLHKPRLSTGRILIQAQIPCPINFEKQNYTIITSKCKGPNYPAIACCAAFSKFACPFTDQLNDLRNMCAKIMFTYINLKGGYTPGHFATECKNSKEGLKCPAAPAHAFAASTNDLHHRRLLIDTIQP